jgi:hypothetical protein
MAPAGEPRPVEAGPEKAGPEKAGPEKAGPEKALPPEAGRPPVEEPPPPGAWKPKYSIESPEELPLLKGTFENRLEEVLKEFVPPAGRIPLAERARLKDQIAEVLRAIPKEWPITARQVAFLASNPELFAKVREANEALVRRAKEAEAKEPGVQPTIPGLTPPGRLFALEEIVRQAEQKIRQQALTTELMQERYGKYGEVSEIAPESFTGTRYGRGWRIQEKSGQMVFVFEGRDGSLDLSMGLNPEYEALGIKDLKPGTIIEGSHRPFALGSIMGLAIMDK